MQVLGERRNNNSRGKGNPVKNERRQAELYSSPGLDLNKKNTFMKREERKEGNNRSRVQGAGVKFELTCRTSMSGKRGLTPVHAGEGEKR